MPERNFEFRRCLNRIHRDDRRDPAQRPAEGETIIATGWHIQVPADASEYLVHTAQDLQDYFLTSMGESVLLVRGETGSDACSGGTIRLTTRAASPDLGAELPKPRSYRLIVKAETITICGYDERGVGPLRDVEPHVGVVGVPHGAGEAPVLLDGQLGHCDAADGP